MIDARRAPSGLLIRLKCVERSRGIDAARRAGRSAVISAESALAGVIDRRSPVARPARLRRLGRGEADRSRRDAAARDPGELAVTSSEKPPTTRPSAAHHRRSRLGTERARVVARRRARSTSGSERSRSTTAGPRRPWCSISQACATSSTRRERRSVGEIARVRARAPGSSCASPASSPRSPPVLEERRASSTVSARAVCMATSIARWRHSSPLNGQSPPADPDRVLVSAPRACGRTSRRGPRRRSPPRRAARATRRPRPRRG